MAPTAPFPLLPPAPWEGKGILESRKRIRKLIDSINGRLEEVGSHLCATPSKSPTESFNRHHPKHAYPAATPVTSQEEEMGLPPLPRAESQSKRSSKIYFLSSFSCTSQARGGDGCLEMPEKTSKDELWQMRPICQAQTGTPSSLLWELKTSQILDNNQSF